MQSARAGHFILKNEIEIIKLRVLDISSEFNVHI
jgi:hypothetical protein